MTVRHERGKPQKGLLWGKKYSTRAVHATIWLPHKLAYNISLYEKTPGLVDLFSFGIEVK
jgi:hypothetical protein